MRASIVLALVLATAAIAHADDACDHGVAVADAKSALLVAPTVFGSAGYVKAGPELGATDPVVSTGPRVTAGLSYRIDGLFAASATRGRARAECRRAAALASITSGPERAALTARVEVLHAALTEAQAILQRTQAEAAERLTTEKALLATRLRFDGLRQAALAARAELAATPALPSPATLASFHAADAEVEEQEARIRRLDAFSVTVRAGYDRFLDRDDDAPFFALLTISVNTGVLFAGGAQDRAAAARKRMVRAEIATAAAAFEAQVTANTTRMQQLDALIADLEAQLESLTRLGGDDGRRHRDTLWFDVVELRAERAAAAARVAAIHQVLAR